MKQDGSNFVNYFSAGKLSIFILTIFSWKEITDLFTARTHVSWVQFIGLYQMAYLDNNNSGSKDHCSNNNSLTFSEV